MKAHKTLDKLKTYGTTESDVCVLCCGSHDTESHLFFDCSYSNNIWSSMLSLLNLRRIDGDVHFWIDWMAHHARGKSFKVWIRKTVLAATVYHIWNERNGRIFISIFNSKEKIRKQIRSVVILKARSWGGIGDTDENRSFCIA
ncbi:zf-RVT domain-containing protein [Cephalotus follicularis]|uniref:Zf-RVT domain-containing protein n=1 Tax=Cephalotus follicularis TaxID=3775 RepID=A0A1Q3BHB1_CEPFO|nr:zf-RVT domain-containing protein [Cephalotus follicularis]